MSRLLPIGIVAFTIASLAIFVFGDSGLAAFRSMSRYERSLAANVESLKQRDQELQARLQLLKSDRESNIVMAREIGMYEPGDTVVKLVGRPPRTEIYAMGDLLRMRKSDSTRNVAFKEAALGGSVVFLLVAFFAAHRGRRKAQRIRPFGSAHGAGRR